MHVISVLTRVKFWQDRWCGQTSLAVCYPKLFRLSRNKDANVADFMHFTNGVLHQDPTLCAGNTRLGIGVLDDFHDYHL